jgi:hypothetical protein
MIFGEHSAEAPENVPSICPGIEWARPTCGNARRSRYRRGLSSALIPPRRAHAAMGMLSETRPLGRTSTQHALAAEAARSREQDQRNEGDFERRDRRKRRHNARRAE